MVSSPIQATAKRLQRRAPRAPPAGAGEPPAESLVSLTHTGAMRALLALLAVASADVCTMEDEERLDCWDAEFPLTQETCEKHGCCWAVHEVPGVPWCFWRYGTSWQFHALRCLIPFLDL